MAKEPRSKANGNQSIVRHPLFPATVALWFGALFGLGSLAIRPGLLEMAILATHVDALIASAAPPLGATSRILLALFMAGMGGLLGARLARRIARPRPVVVPRKRGASAVGNAHKAARQAYLAPESSETAVTQIAGGTRRRQLAIAEDVRPPEYRDQVPLPGGAPQILDVSAFDLDGFETDESEDLELAARPQAASERRWAFDGPAGPAPAETFRDHAEIPPCAQVFQPSVTDSDMPDSQDEPSVAPANAPVANGLFDAYSQGLGANASSDAMPTPSAPAPFSAPAAPAMLDDDIEPDANSAALPRLGTGGHPLEAAEQVQPMQPTLRRPAIELEPAPRLFGGPASEVAAPFGPPRDKDENEWPEEIELSAGRLAPLAPAAESEAPIFGPPSAGPQSDEPDEDRIAVREAAVDMERLADGRSAAERIATAELDELSQVELLDRLARTLERRRGRAEAASGDEQDKPADPTPAGYADAANQAAGASHGEESRAPIAPPPISIPAALRPIGLGEDDDDDLLPSFVPPRRIAMPLDRSESGDVASPTGWPESEQAGTQTDSFAKPDGPRNIEDEDEGTGEDSRILEEGYSSLLDLSRPADGKQQFVRIEEPEFAGGEIEPVVVFPGQETARNAPFAAPDPQAGPDGAARTPPFAPPPERQQTSHPEPVAPPQRQQDPAETERALRTALATLQRMSGAA